VVRGMPRIRDGLLLGRAIGHLPCAVATHTMRLNFLVNGFGFMSCTGDWLSWVTFYFFLSFSSQIPETILDLSHVPVGPAHIGTKSTCGHVCVCVCVCVCMCVCVCIQGSPVEIQP